MSHAVDTTYVCVCVLCVRASIVVPDAPLFFFVGSFLRFFFFVLIRR